MKLIFFLLLITLISKVVYFVAKKNKKNAIAAAVITAILLTTLLAQAIYRGNRAPDIWCGNVHENSSYPPENLKTSTDYFEQGNYDYDTGDCKKAIEDYTKSISLNSKYPQAYNNRAYTNMRLRNYKDALPDLDRAIALKPDYVQALMNRGDIHNYYFEIDRKSSIADYEKVIALAGYKGSSVCGHLFLAKHNGWNLGTFLNAPFNMLQCMSYK